MNCCFYLAIDRLPLSTVAAIEFLPVVLLAAIGARTPRNAVALALAAPGVLLLTGVHLGAGATALALAGANAVLFAVYIVLADRVAKEEGVSGVDGLAASMLVAAVVITPMAGWAAVPAFDDPVAIVAGIGVGLCSSVIPYVADQLALARLPRATYALMVSLLPATATVIGIVVLTQVPSAREVAGVALVVAGVALHRPASVGRSGEGDADEPVVVAGRVAAAVAVARREPERVARRIDRHGADAAELALEQRLGLTQLVALHRDAPQALTAQRADPQVAARVGQPAGGGLRGRPGHERVRVLAALRVALALDLGPAVVLALLDEVDLVEGVLAELARPQPPVVVPVQALDVAVAQRPVRVALDGVVVRDRAVGLIRRILPPGLAGSCERLPSSPSPVVMYSLPSGPNASRPPSWFVER